MCRPGDTARRRSGGSSVRHRRAERVTQVVERGVERADCAKERARSWPAELEAVSGNRPSTRGAWSNAQVVGEPERFDEARASAATETAEGTRLDARRA